MSRSPSPSASNGKAWIAPGRSSRTCSSKVNPSLLLQPHDLALGDVAEDADGDVLVAVAVEVRGLRAGDPPDAVEQHDRLEVQPPVVPEEDDLADEVVGREDLADIGDEEVTVPVSVDVRDVGADRLDQPLGEGHHLPVLLDPGDLAARRLRREYLRGAVAQEVGHPHVGRHLGRSAG